MFSFKVQILCAAVLTAYIGVSGLMVTMAKDGVMPSVMFSRNSMKRVVCVKMRKIVNILKGMNAYLI